MFAKMRTIIVVLLAVLALAQAININNLQKSIATLQGTLTHAIMFSASSCSLPLCPLHLPLCIFLVTVREYASQQ